MLGTLRKQLKLAALAATLPAMLAQAAAAHEPHTHGHGPDPVDHEFRASHPFKVFVDTSKGRRGHQVDDADYYVTHTLADALPGYVVLVSNRRDADMVVRAQLVHQDLSFHVTDVDRRKKKYKKKYRYMPGRCGHFQRAFYTRITEKGVGIADYRLSFRLKGAGVYEDEVRVRAAESYRLGKDLTALTNCGVVPTNHYPNSKVALIFSRNDGSYRHVVAQDIRQKRLQKLSHILTDRILGRTEQFYAHLAARHAGLAEAAPHYERSRSRPGANPRVYDFDEVAPTRRRTLSLLDLAQGEWWH